MITTTLIGSNNNCNNNDNSDDIDNYNPSNIFALRDCSKRITCPNTPPTKKWLIYENITQAIIPQLYKT